MDEKLEPYLTKRKLLLIVFLLLLIIVLFIVTIGEKSLEKEVLKKAKEDEIRLVTNASRFYTVSSCIDKYLTYLGDHDEEKLLAVLSSNYINKKEITEENILEKIESVPSGSYTYEARKMYQEKILNEITKYYVLGNMVKNELLEINAQTEKKVAYYIVILDESTLSFSIEPYDGQLFKQETNHE